MKIHRLYAGVAVATLVATSAFAQTGSTTAGSTTAAPSATPQAATPGGQPPMTPGTPTAPMTPGSMAPGSMAPGAMAPGAMPPGAMPPGAMPPAAGASTGFTPITPSPASNIVMELKSAGEFNSLLSVLDTTNLTNLISTHPNITLLAPTDAAFAALPPGTLDALKKDPTRLQALLTYHLIGAKIVDSDVQGHAAGKVMTVASKQVTIDGTASPIKVNDASVLQAGVPASNGVIYVIDKVLTPPA